MDRAKKNQPSGARGKKSLAKNRPPLTAEAMMEMARGFQSSRVLLTAHELGVFPALAKGRQTSAMVAQAIRSDVRATDRLLNACVALGFLVKKKDRFSLTPVAAQHLLPGLPGFLGGLDHTVKMWQTWGTLTEAVRKGTSVALPPMERRGEKWFVPFIAAMHTFASPHAPGVVAQLDLSKVSQVLDVGGGSGAYSIAFANAKPNLTATVFDLPLVVPLTQGYVREAGLTARVKMVKGDFHSDPLPRGFDLVFVSAIIHMLSPAETLGLFRKCARALKPGGQLVVQDFVMDRSRTDPPQGALFALNMLVATRVGDTYTEAEIRSWMNRAGLKPAQRLETGTGSTLVIGRRGKR
jgi:SAM-dependent methyltransferase